MGDQYEEMKAKSKSIDTAGQQITWAVPEGVVMFPSPIEDYEMAAAMAEEHQENYRPSKADRLRTALKEPTNWRFDLPEGAKEATIILANGTIRRYAIVSSSTGEAYDTVTIYKNKKTEEPMGQVVGKGNWSDDFIYDFYFINDEEHKVAYKLYLCDIAEDGSNALLYISHTTDLDNVDYFYPHEMGRELYDAVGPLIQFASVDVRGNHKENDKLVYDTYAVDGCKWFADATHWLFKKYPDCYHQAVLDLISDLYNYRNKDGKRGGGAQESAPTGAI